jgi:hypothetical protein
MNKTNETILLLLRKFDDSWDTITYDYIIPTISLFNFFSNFVCALVFIEIIKVYRQDGNKMFHYLFLKSLCDLLNGLIEAFYPLYGLDSLSTSSTFLINIWYIYLHKYVAKVMLMASGFLEIVASFDCAIAMDKRLKCCQRWISFIFINIFIFIFCFVYNVYAILAYDIIKVKSNNSTKTFYDKRDRQFLSSKEYDYLHLMNSLFRDVIVVALLFAINFYILVNLKRLRKRKSQLQILNNCVKNKKTRAEIAERRKLKMICVLCLIYIFGHLPSIFYYLKVFEYTYFQITFYAIADIIYYISYASPIFVYYLFNNNFKSILEKRIKLPLRWSVR